MIALLAAALLQTATPPGISFDEAVSLPANDLAVRMLGEAGRPYVGATRPRAEQRSPPTGFRFFTRPEATTTQRLCTMHSTSVATTMSAPGQDQLDSDPEGWRRYRKLVTGPPTTQELFRPSGLGFAGDYSDAQAICGRLEPKNGPGWFWADSLGSAALALQFAERLLPSERNGALSTEPAVNADSQRLLSRMRLDRMGMVRSSRCNLLAAEPGHCLVLFFSHPDDNAHPLSLIVSYAHSREGLTILAVRTIDAFVYVP